MMAWTRGWRRLEPKKILIPRTIALCRFRHRKPSHRVTRSGGTYDGRIGEGWSGTDPDGAHVNVVLAERGTPTAAAMLSALTSPAPGHIPILVVVGEDKQHYEPVWPPTIMVNKATATEPLHQTITWGAGQLGIAQGVLDAVAQELIPCSGEVLVFVAIYIDSAAEDEIAVRIASRTATLKGIRTARQGRDPVAARALVDRRERLSSPFYGGT